MFLFPLRSFFGVGTPGTFVRLGIIAKVKNIPCKQYSHWDDLNHDLIKRLYMTDLGQTVNNFPCLF